MSNGILLICLLYVCYLFRSSATLSLRDCILHLLVVLFHSECTLLWFSFCSYLSTSLPVLTSSASWCCFTQTTSSCRGINSTEQLWGGFLFLVLCWFLTRRGPAWHSPRDVLHKEINSACATLSHFRGKYRGGLWCKLLLQTSTKESLAGCTFTFSH